MIPIPCTILVGYSKNGLKIRSDVISKLALKELSIHFFWAGIAINNAGCTACIRRANAARNGSLGVGNSETGIVDKITHGMTLGFQAVVSQEHRQLVMKPIAIGYVLPISYERSFVWSIKLVRLNKEAGFNIELLLARHTRFYIYHAPDRVAAIFRREGPIHNINSVYLIRTNH